MQIGCTGDWHIDGTEPQFDYVKRSVSLMPKNLILMGDMLDTGISLGMNWNQENLNIQLEQFRNIIKNKKVIGYVLGNHEYRVVRLTGLNLYESFLGFEREQYKIDNRIINIEHGSRAPQDQMKQIQDLADIHPDSAVCLMGHTHGLAIDRNYNNQWLARTGHLQLYPDYARRKIMKPKAKGYIRYDTVKNRVYIEPTELK